jgi:cyclase
MPFTRVIPCLLLKGRGLVKTVKFKDPAYLGDPRNAVKIFNEKEVDELVILDITATVEKRGPNFDLIKEIADEAFMPIGYGGGVSEIQQARQLLNMGIEKIIINTQAFDHPSLIEEMAKGFGTQSVVVSIDVKKNLFGHYEAFVLSGKRNTKLDPVVYAKQMEARGAGEILINSIDKDGTMSGYDLQLIKKVATAVSVPVVACGGAGKVADLREAVVEGNASAAAAGSLFVYHGKHRAVLISYPQQKELKELFDS